MLFQTKKDQYVEIDLEDVNERLPGAPIYASLKESYSEDKESYITSEELFSLRCHAYEETSVQINADFLDDIQNQLHQADLKKPVAQMEIKSNTTLTQTPPTLPSPARNSHFQATAPYYAHLRGTPRSHSGLATRRSKVISYSFR